jgi:hypothetical protein
MTTTPTAPTTPKSGIVQFKNQKEIIIDRQKQTELRYKALQKRVSKILQANYNLVQKSTSDKE